MLEDKFIANIFQHYLDNQFTIFYELSKKENKIIKDKHQKFISLSNDFPHHLKTETVLCDSIAVDYMCEIK